MNRYLVKSFIQRRLFQTVRYSARGFGFAWRHEEALRVEVLLCALLGPLALWLGESPVERVLLLLPCVLVIVVELINSAIEAVVDLCSPQVQPLAAAAKDMGSAAVLVCLVLVPVVWLLILL